MVIGRKAFLLITAAVGVTGMIAGCSRAGSAARGDSNALTILTQNIRTTDSDTTEGDPDHWPDRRPVLQDMLKETDPDVLGTQEVTWEQIPALDEVLAETHQRLGMGREGGSHGENCLLYFRKERFELLEWDQFWLSQTPEEIGSVGWDAQIPRIAVWARVRDQRTDGELILSVTHLDHQGPQAQVSGAELVAQRLHEAAGANTPIILMGDFNSEADNSDPWDRLTGAGFEDAHDAAETIDGDDIGTFPNYQPAFVGGPRIDWIMTQGMKINTYTVRDHEVDGVHASDHAYVQVVAEVPTNA